MDMKIFRLFEIDWCVFFFEILLLLPTMRQNKTIYVCSAFFVLYAPLFIVCSLCAHHVHQKVAINCLMVAATKYTSKCVRVAFLIIACNVKNWPQSFDLMCNCFNFWAKWNNLRLIFFSSLFTSRWSGFYHLCSTLWHAILFVSGRKHVDDGHRRRHSSQSAHVSQI